MQCYIYNIAKVAGIALAYAVFDDALHCNEATSELSYRMELNGNLFIQPDL